MNFYTFISSNLSLALDPLDYAEHFRAWSLLRQVSASPFARPLEAIYWAMGTLNAALFTFMAFSIVAFFGFAHARRAPQPWCSSFNVTLGKAK